MGNSNKKVTDAVFESYSPSYGTLKAVSQLPWDIIIEPNKGQIIKLSKFVLEGIDVDTKSDEFSMIWTILGEEYYGPEFEVILTKVGVFTGTVKIFQKTLSITRKSNMKLIYSEEFSIAVKYIRREIRSLTDTDRKRVFTAFRKLYSVSQEDGKRIYGPAYISAETLLLTHLTAAGTSKISIYPICI